MIQVRFLTVRHCNPQKWNHWWNTRKFYSLLARKMAIWWPLAGKFLIATFFSFIAHEIGADNFSSWFLCSAKCCKIRCHKKQGNETKKVRQGLLNPDREIQYILLKRNQSIKEYCLKRSKFMLPTKEIPFKFTFWYTSLSKTETCIKRITFNSVLISFTK